MFFFCLCSLYTIFPARAPAFNTTQYLELIKFEPNPPHGLGRTADKQAAFQFAALSVTLASAIIGGLLTGKAMTPKLHTVYNRQWFYSVKGKLDHFQLTKNLMRAGLEIAVGEEYLIPNKNLHNLETRTLDKLKGKPEGKYFKQKWHLR